MNLATDRHHQRHGKTSFTPLPCEETVTAFAQIDLGQKTFQIANFGSRGSLAFRDGGDGSWIGLSRRIEDGWNRIGADIVLSDPEVFDHFLRTHAVRVSGAVEIGQTIVFAMMNSSWSARLLSDTRVGMRIAEGDWVETDLEPGPQETLRDRLIAAFETAFPDAAERFSDDLDHWAERIAAGAAVRPL